MDRIIPKVFDANLNKNIEIISRKVLTGQYRFTHYREILISKGRDKCPRVISIPTIRDKLALAAFHVVLHDAYENTIEEPLIHTVISKIAKNIKSGNYDGYVKVDIKHFYASINHDILLNKVKEKIHEKEALDFLYKAISTATVPEGTRLTDVKKNKKGVPEGLSISNILANIYLHDLKQPLMDKYKIAYFRYVDDILILCDHQVAKAIKEDIVSILDNEYDLDVHPEKTVFGELKDGVPYLGYIFYCDQIGVRDSAILRIENNLEALFRLRSKNKISQELFEWRLNLKIAGCIYEHKKYGWLFYYSQLTDLTELYHLDWFVGRLFERFNLERPDSLMKFVRVYHEIIHNVSRSTYLINADKYSIEQKTDILQSVLGQDRALPSVEKDVNELFREVMFKEIQKLEVDVQDFS